MAAAQKRYGINGEGAGCILIAISLIFLSLIVFKIHMANVWSQITFLIGESPVTLLSSNSPHALRYAVMLPVIAISYLTHVHYDIVFSYEVWGLIGLTSCGLGKCICLIKRRSERAWPIHAIWPMCFLYVLSLLMNGRIAIAMAGMALMLLTQLRYVSGLKVRPYRVMFTHFFCILLMSVSSGTFMVGLAVMMVFIGYQSLTKYPLIRKKDMVLLVFGLGLLAASLRLTISFIIKNVDFYGGGIEGAVNLLDHGPGAIFVENQALLVGLVPFAGAAIYGLDRFRKVLTKLYLTGSILGPVYTTAVSACCFGMFGFSTLTMLTMPFLIVASVAKLFPDKPVVGSPEFA